MIKVVKNFFATRTQKVSMAAVALFAALATSAFAAEGDVTIDTEGVTSTFSSIAKTVLVVVGSVAATAVTIMGVFLAWKYGRKMWNALAK